MTKEEIINRLEKIYHSDYDSLIEKYHNILQDIYSLINELKNSISKKSEFVTMQSILDLPQNEYDELKKSGKLDYLIRHELIID